MLFTLSQAATNILLADRCNIYLVNHKERRMNLLNMDGTVSTTLNTNLIFVGNVALSGKSLNIVDCYKNDKFDPSFDKKTGYHTKSMLIIPVWSEFVPKNSQKPIAVVQVL